MLLKYIKKYIYIFILFATHVLIGESFRIHQLISVYIPSPLTEEQSFFSGINDSLVLFLPEDTSFMEGIEIKMQIPQIISKWTDSVACSIYDKVSPFPSAAQIDYSGKKIFVTALPPLLSWIIQIPLKENTSIKNSQYTAKVSVVPNISNKYIFIRFQPAMKGIPEEMINSEIKLSIKPMLIDKGKLDLVITTPEKNAKPYGLFIDGKPADLTKNTLMLNTGMHNINIQSEEYRNEVRSILIEQAKISKLEINLKSSAPTLMISAPDNAEIFFDGNPFDKREKPIPVSEGEHKLRFLIGGYELIRTVNIQKGRAYNVNLYVDLQITEE